MNLPDFPVSFQNLNDYFYEILDCSKRNQLLLLDSHLFDLYLTAKYHCPRCTLALLFVKFRDIRKIENIYIWFSLIWEKTSDRVPREILYKAFKKKGLCIAYSWHIKYMYERPRLVWELKVEPQKIFNTKS